MESIQAFKIYLNKERKTKMIKKAEETGRTFGVVTTEACVEGALRDLGSNEVCTFGAKSHDIQSKIL